MFTAALFTVVQTWKQPKYPIDTHNGLVVTREREGMGGLTGKGALIYGDGRFDFGW